MHPLNPSDIQLASMQLTTIHYNSSFIKEWGCNFIAGWIRCADPGLQFYRVGMGWACWWGAEAWQCDHFPGNTQAAQWKKGSFGIHGFGDVDLEVFSQAKVGHQQDGHESLCGHPGLDPWPWTTGKQACGLCQWHRSGHDHTANGHSLCPWCWGNQGATKWLWLVTDTVSDMWKDREQHARDPWLVSCTRSGGRDVVQFLGRACSVQQRPETKETEEGWESHCPSKQSQRCSWCWCQGEAEEVKEEQEAQKGRADTHFEKDRQATSPHWVHSHQFQKERWWTPVDAWDHAETLGYGSIKAPEESFVWLRHRKVQDWACTMQGHDMEADPRENPGVLQQEVSRPTAVLDGFRMF